MKSHKSPFTDVFFLLQAGVGSSCVRGNSIILVIFIRQVASYLEYRVQTTLSIDDQETSLPFPSITICNYNQFRKSLAIRSPDLMALLKDLFSIESRVDMEEVQKRDEPDTAPLLSNRWNLTAELISMAHVLEQMVIMCYWCGVKITCHEYFSRTLTEVGVCYTFNSEKVQKEKNPLTAYCAGSDCGLTLRMNIQTNEHYFGEGDASGIRVSISGKTNIYVLIVIFFEVINISAFRRHIIVCIFCEGSVWWTKFYCIFTADELHVGFNSPFLCC